MLLFRYIFFKKSSYLLGIKIHISTIRYKKNTIEKSIIEVLKFLSNAFIKMHLFMKF